MRMPGAGSVGEPNGKGHKETFYFILIFYFLAASGLSFGIRDLSLWPTSSSLQCMGFSLVVCRFSLSS